MTSHEERGEIRMGEDKNVFLTIMRNEQDDELRIDFGIIAKHTKRLFALWLCLAVGLGCLSIAAGFLSQKILRNQTAKILISFPNTVYDVTKIKSPAVVGEALQEMGLDILRIEDFRSAVEIGGVISNSDYEQLSMYYDLFNKNNADLKVMQSLLETDYNVSSYVISFNFPDVGLSEKEGVAFLNTLLRAYQNYCMKVYNQDLSMGNPLGAIDYREYDYAEAVNIFTVTLNNITSYLSALRNKSDAFRSVETGLSFQDLNRTASLLKNIDLDRISSYIVIHSVSERDAETEVSYYRWRIELLEQERNVQRTRFNALADSINNYQKDSIIILNGVDGGSMASNPEDINANYDGMIQEKLDTQASIAASTRSISYYESVIKGFEDAEASSKPEDIELVRGYLESLNEKVNKLIRDITLTANEYYETAAFADEVRILVPATAENPPLINSATKKIVLTVEALLFAVYVCVVLVRGIREANPPETEKKRDDQPNPATVTTV